MTQKKNRGMERKRKKKFSRQSIPDLGRTYIIRKQRIQSPATSHVDLMAMRNDFSTITACNPGLK